MTRDMATTDAVAPGSLREYWRVAVRRKSMIAIAILFAVAGSIALSLLQTPIYVAETRMLVEPRATASLFADEPNLNVPTLDRAIQTEIEVLEAPGVRSRVQADVGLDQLPPPASASPVGSTDVVRVSVRSTDARSAQILADAYAQAYIDERREQAISDQLTVSQEVESRLAALRVEVDEIDAQVAAAPAEDRTAASDRFAGRRASLVSQISTLEQHLNNLQVSTALTTGGASIIQSADLPSTPVEPTLLRAAAMAAIAGLLIGLGAAFLLDHVDDSMRSSSDIESVTAIPPLAVVPVQARPDDRPIALSRPSDLAIEAYRGLRANVQFLGLDAPMTTVQVTSSLPGEGKTTTATNLAVVLARAGRSVLLVDADLRRPGVAQAFSLPVRPGLTDLLLGEPTDLCTSEVEDGLHVIVAGTTPLNPSELLSSERTRAVFDELNRRFDHVIVDSPPVLPVADPLAVSGLADAVLVVAQAKRTSKRALGAALERLARVDANVIGIVLNKAVVDQDGYGYGYGYGSRPGAVSAESSASSNGTPIGDSRPFGPAPAERRR